jgi:hypothetical protein
MAFLDRLFRRNNRGSQTTKSPAGASVQTPLQSSTTELVRENLKAAIRELCPEENFDLLVETLEDGSIKMTLVTESQLVELAWVYVQEVLQQQLEE